MTHAFFKALLFMAAGVVVAGLREEHDMFRMGGLRRQAPLACWTFIIGAGALAGLPIITAGFYSKGLILWQAWSSPSGGPWLWAAGIVGVLITAVYSFRMVFLTFFGPERQRMTRWPGLNMQVPLVLLAILSIIAGWVELPAWLGNYPFFTDFLRQAVPALPGRGGFTTEWILELIAAALAVGGVLVAYVLYLARPGLLQAAVRAPVGAALHRFWLEDWGFDWLYERIAVRPYRWLASTDREDAVDLIYRGMGWTVEQLHRGVARSQTGYLRWYAAGVTVGAIVIVGIVAFS
jgi:NADH-quinone oxidoreductase subunit L